MVSINIKKGLSIKLAGRPSTEIKETGSSSRIHVFPPEFEGIKPRLETQEGASVARGAVLFSSKANPSLKFRAPAGGLVEKIVLGERRILNEIIIKVDPSAGVEQFTRYPMEKLGSLSREEVLTHLQHTGYLALLLERPFGKIANPAVTPKSIFVNAMSTGLFQPDPNLVIKGEESSFKAGLEILRRLTPGKVHLVLPADQADLSTAYTSATGVELHKFSGKHPAGNPSIHIHRIDPVSPGQHVWTIKAAQVVMIGRLFLTGELASTTVISVGGSGIAAEARHHYRIQIGGEISRLIEGHLCSGEQRVILGDIFSGRHAHGQTALGFYDTAITVIPEGRERHFLGWLLPGLNRFSTSPLYLSKWLCPNKEWPMNTSLNGSKRAMVLTGLYDRYMPMNIMVDYLIRAVLAKDSTEAVKLGLLETMPEDFAACAFACPSKMDLPGIIREGLAQVEKEGI